MGRAGARSLSCLFLTPKRRFPPLEPLPLGGGRNWGILHRLMDRVNQKGQENLMPFASRDGFYIHTLY